MVTSPLSFEMFRFLRSVCGSQLMVCANSFQLMHSIYARRRELLALNALALGRILATQLIRERENAIRGGLSVFIAAMQRQTIIAPSSANRNAEARTDEQQLDVISYSNAVLSINNIRLRPLYLFDLYISDGGHFKCLAFLLKVNNSPRMSGMKTSFIISADRRRPFCVSRFLRPQNFLIRSALDAQRRAISIQFSCREVNVFKVRPKVERKRAEQKIIAGRVCVCARAFEIQITEMRQRRQWPVGRSQRAESS